MSNSSMQKVFSILTYTARLWVFFFFFFNFSHESRLHVVRYTQWVFLEMMLLVDHLCFQDLNSYSEPWLTSKSLDFTS